MLIVFSLFGLTWTHSRAIVNFVDNAIVIQFCLSQNLSSRFLFTMFLQSDFDILLELLYISILTASLVVFSN